MGVIVARREVSCLMNKEFNLMSFFPGGKILVSLLTMLGTGTGAVVQVFLSDKAGKLACRSEFIRE